MANRKQVDGNGSTQSVKLDMGNIVNIGEDDHKPILPLTNIKKSGSKNERLDRESQDCYTVVLLGGIFILTDVWKQVATYGMKYFNDNHYPLPQTQVIAMTEMMKLLVFFIVVVKQGQLFKITISVWLIVPSVIFAINNNIYLLGLHYTTPPVWNILIQFRILFTALTYRIIFKRILSRTQWVSLMVLITAIVLTNFSTKVEGYGNLLFALLLAVIGSMTSVVGAVTMEYLFKNDKRSFSEMQLQLYFFGSIASWILYFLQTSGTPFNEASNAQPTNTDVSSAAFILMVLSMVLSVGGGIVVATIVKKLDNIVKLYTQALANMLTSIACWIIFPNHFQLNIQFIGCLALMFCAIFGYENKNIRFEDLKVWVKEGQFYRKLFIAVVVAFLIIFIMTYSSEVRSKTREPDKPM